MKIAYFDCFSGAAGDMIVGALVHAGANQARLVETLERLSVGGFRLSFEKLVKQGVAATQFVVQLDASTNQPHRHLKHVVEIIRGAKLSAGVAERAVRVFERLAAAEAEVHGTSVEKVHFHEVGAIDAIADVVGACVGLEDLGIERVYCSPIPTGSGTVKCEHGVLPVPAPATALLLKGIPLAPSDEIGELTTPTGAAILGAISAGFGPPPAMTIDAIGYGSGTRENKTRPNVIRVLLGESTTVQGDADEIMVLETNLDDATPQVIGFCMERLLSAGALDAFALPIQMKKGRPGVLLTVLAEVHQTRAIERVLFEETPTLGIRRRVTQRTKMKRRHETVVTPYGEIRMKIGEFDGLTTSTPEFEDCKAAALRGSAALREVIAAAQAAWRNR